MRIDVLTLFPDMFMPVFTKSIAGIAVKKKALDIYLTDFRDFTFTKHRQVDDYPYGGGAGMVIKPEPIYEALKFIKPEENTPVIYFTPQGKLLNQTMVRKYARLDRVILLCGHYKEIDQRIRDKFVTEEISVGDYVLSGGEIPAMLFTDALARLQEGVLSDEESANTDSHENGLLGCPHYTRPPEFLGMGIPDVLLSGHHKKIEEWRQAQSIEITKRVRPELLPDE